MEASTDHVSFVFQKDGQFFQEWNHQHQQLLVVAFKKFDQQSNYVFISHLQFCPCVLSKVQQKIKRDWRNEKSLLSFEALVIEVQMVCSATKILILISLSGIKLQHKCNIRVCYTSEQLLLLSQQALVLFQNFVLISSQRAVFWSWFTCTKIKEILSASQTNYTGAARLEMTG